MTLAAPETFRPSGSRPGSCPPGHAASRGRAYVLAGICLLLGPLGLAYVDRKHALPGLVCSVFFWGGLYLAWPALAPIFAALGLSLTARQALRWTRAGTTNPTGESAGRGASWAESLRFFLPLSLDLSILILLDALLWQAWFNRQRGSLTAAILILCVTTPILLIAARAIGNRVVRRALRAFEAGCARRTEP